MPEDRIGIAYYVNLASYRDGATKLRNEMTKLHAWIANSAKKTASMQKDAFKSASSMGLDKNAKLVFKEVSESFSKLRGTVPRMTKDFETLFSKFKGDPFRLSQIQKEFVSVNNAVGKMSLAMDAAGKNGKLFYETANRSALVQSKLRGEIKTTADGLQRVIEKEREVIKTRVDSTQMTKNATSALRNMGITSDTSTKAFQKMNLTTLDHQKIAKLTTQQMKRLETTTFKNASTTQIASERYDKLAKRLAHSQAEIRKQTGAMGDSRRAMERWSLSGMKAMALSQAAWLASGAVIFGVIGAISESIKVFMNFNQELKDAAAIVQATTTGYKEMREAALNAFTSSTMGAIATAQTLKTLGQAGLDATESAKVLETIYKITTATGADAGEAVQFMTTALNVWKFSAEDAAKVGNVLGAALNYSKLEVEDIGTIFNYTASMAAQLGMSIEDLAATVAVLRQAGIKASTIGTGLTQLFTTLLKPTESFKKQLNSVGLTMNDVSLITNDFFTVLNRLQGAGFDIEKIFKGIGVRPARTLTALLNQGTDVIDKMKKSITDTAALDVMFNRSMEGMKNQIILLGHSIQAGIVQGLEYAKPAIIRTTKLLMAFIDAIKVLAPALAIGTVAFIAFNGAMMAFGLISTNALAGLYVFLGSIHPAILAIGAVTAALTIGIRLWDAYGKTYKKVTDQLIREIDDLSKLESLLEDENKTREEKLEILADYAKDYPELLRYMDREKVSMREIIDITKELNKEKKEATKLAREQRVEWLKSAISEMESNRRGGGMSELGLPEIFEFDAAKLRAYQAELVKLKVLLGEIKVTPGRSKKTGGTAAEMSDEDFKDMIEFEKERFENLRDLYTREIQEEAKGSADRAKISEELHKKLIDYEKEYRNTEFELLKQAKMNELDEADYREWLGEAEFKREKELLKDKIKLMEEYRDEIAAGIIKDPAIQEQIDQLDALIAKFKELVLVKKEALGHKPSDIHGGIKKGFDEALEEINDQYKLWKEATKETMLEMKDTMSDVFFDAMTNELKTASDYWKAFTDIVKRYIADIAAQWAMAKIQMGLSSLAGAFAGSSSGVSAGSPAWNAGTAHTGGLQIGKMHSGGIKSDELLKILKRGEYVVKDSSVRSIGVQNLDQMNRTGQMPSGPTMVDNRKYSYYIAANDAESFDKMIRTKGAKAVSEVSIAGLGRARRQEDRRLR